jgi:TolB protein
MIKKMVLVCILSMYGFATYASELSVAASGNQKLSLVMCFLGSSSSFEELGTTLARDLSFSGQFAVSVQQWGNQKATKASVAALYDAGYVLALFINKKGSHYLEWRLYDTIDQTLTMLAGKKYHKQGTSVRGWAHALADGVWPVIAGQPGFFSSKLAFCTDERSAKGHRITKVCVADFDGSHPQILVDSPTINLAPRWNSDKTNPLLFYSEHTNQNVRLMAVDMRKKVRVTSNFDGINMLPTFSADGKRAVYCASRGGGACHLYLYDKDSFRKITNNEGNNVSPSLSADGQRVYFCSDFQTGSPQIYVYDIAQDMLERLTLGGYCASPCYSSACNKVVYCKIVNGITQLYLYDCATKNHSQITHDAGHKEECAWSPCGNYLVFSHQQGKKSNVCMLNLLTKERKVLVDHTADCTYPTWSPLYHVYPVMG